MATEQSKKYALEAMKKLIELKFGFNESTKIAKKAWDISDEMTKQERLREEYD